MVCTFLHGWRHPSLPLIGEALGCADPKPPLPGEVARRSRDGEVAANLIQPLSQPSAASSPARGAFFSLRRGNPSGAPRQLPLTRGALGACKTTTNQCKKVQTSKSGLHLLLTANIQPQLLTNSVSRIRRRVVRHTRGDHRVERRLKNRASPKIRGSTHPASPRTLFSPIFSLAREKIGPSETTGSCKFDTTSQSRLRRASAFSA